jgi:hypothetical protein
MLWSQTKKICFRKHARPVPFICLSQSRILQFCCFSCFVESISKFKIQFLPLFFNIKTHFLTHLTPFLLDSFKLLSPLINLHLKYNLESSKVSNQILRSVSRPIPQVISVSFSFQIPNFLIALIGEFMKFNWRTPPERDCSSSSSSSLLSPLCLLI